MGQHIGAPCKPLVKKGDIVKKGQMVGESQGFVSARARLYFRQGDGRCTLAASYHGRKITCCNYRKNGRRRLV